MRVGGIQVLEQAHGKALERPDVRLAPAHEGGVHPIVPHAPLVGLVKAATILRDGGPEHAEHDGLARVEPREERRPRVRRARVDDAAPESVGVKGGHSRVPVQ